MANRTTEDIIGELYDLVQDARAMPLAMDKCILERDKVLDLLDEVIAQLPSELKQARTIVENRADLISQGKREKENIIRKAQEQAKALVSQEAICVEAKQLAEEIEKKANERAAQIQRAGNAYMDESLRQTEELIAQTLAKCQEMAKANMDECAERIRQTEAQMEQIKAASFGYVDNSLRQTEETILKALNEVKGTRTKFQNITKPAAVADSNQYDQEL